MAEHECIQKERIAMVESDERGVAERLYDVGMSMEKLVGSVNALTSRIDKHSAEQKSLLEKYDRHIDEGDKEGGYRDRLKLLEVKILGDDGLCKQFSAIKKSYWKVGLIVGVSMGLIFKYAPSLAEKIFDVVFRIAKGI